MHEVLVNRLGGLSLPRKSVVRLTDRRIMTLDVYRGRKTTIQQQLQHLRYGSERTDPQRNGWKNGKWTIPKLVPLLLMGGNKNIRHFFI